MNKKYAVTAFGIILIIPFITYVFVSHFNSAKAPEANQIAITPTPTAPLPFADTVSPDVVASNFYTDYQNCMRAGINHSATQTLSQFCQIDTKLTLPSYDEKVKAQTPNSSGIDPVFCEKTTPPDVNKDLKLGNPNIQNDTATVSITGTYPNRKVVILFSFQRNTLHEWKIANIECH